MIRSLLAVSTLFLGSCATLSTEDMLVSRHAAQVRTLYGTGSGFPISETAWLTAWHVVEHSPEHVLIDGWVVTQVIRLEGLDAAVLVTAPHGEKPWPLANRAARPGERVFKSGYGQGFHWWTEGIASGDPDRAALDIYPGDSGCPMFNAAGEVLGIVVAVGSSRHGLILHHCWVVPMPDILAAIPAGVLGPAPDLLEAAMR